MNHGGLGRDVVVVVAAASVASRCRFNSWRRQNKSVKTRGAKRRRETERREGVDGGESERVAR